MRICQSLYHSCLGGVLAPECGFNWTANTWGMCVVHSMSGLESGCWESPLERLWRYVQPVRSVALQPLTGGRGDADRGYEFQLADLAQTAIKRFAFVGNSQRRLLGSMLNCVVYNLLLRGMGDSLA